MAASASSVCRSSTRSSANAADVGERDQQRRLVFMRRSRRIALASLACRCDRAPCLGENIREAALRLCLESTRVAAAVTRAPVPEIGEPPPARSAALRALGLSAISRPSGPPAAHRRFRRASRRRAPAPPSRLQAWRCRDPPRERASLKVPTEITSAFGRLISFVRTFPHYRPASLRNCAALRLCQESTSTPQPGK
jgi:hypothetical protein